MAPGNPERGLGQPVWDVPPEGAVRKPVGIRTEVVRDEGYKAVVRATYSVVVVGGGSDQGLGTSIQDSVITTYVVCEEQDDGAWLVARETPDLTP